MLVLSRHIGETIDISQGKIKLSILSIRKNKVTVGIEAPEEIDIRRAEVQNKRKSKNNETD